MSRRNFKVATTQEGKTTLVKIDKTPTGKVKTIKDREKVRKEREEQYHNFRINALKRRAARMKLSEEEINKAVEELKKQMDTPNQYDILLFFNPNNANLVKEALQNEGITWKIMGYNPKKESDGYAFLIGDQEVLATIREIVPPGTKIHPYVKKKPPILPVEQPKSRGAKTKTKAEKKSAAAATKKARKAAKSIKSKDGRRQVAIAAHKAAKNKAARKAQKAKKLFDKRCQKALKKSSGTVVQLKAKKGSTAPKKASTLKQAA